MCDSMRTSCVPSGQGQGCYALQKMRDLLDWFCGNRGYQTRITAILRAFMNAHVHH